MDGSVDRRVAVVVVLEAPEGVVSHREAERGAAMAVLSALQRAGDHPDGRYGIFLQYPYVDGEPSFFQVFGVDSVNTMLRERAVTVTGRLWGEKGVGQ